MDSLIQKPGYPQSGHYTLYVQCMHCKHHAKNRWGHINGPFIFPLKLPRFTDSLTVSVSFAGSWSQIKAFGQFCKFQILCWRDDAVMLFQCYSNDQARSHHVKYFHVRIFINSKVVLKVNGNSHIEFFSRQKKKMSFYNGSKCIFDL